MKAQLAPITDDDLGEVGRFLQAELNERVSADTWAAALRPDWPGTPPNHGFLLRSDGEVVGVYLALYSERVVDGTVRPFCNLAAWCVKPEFRVHSFRLLRALITQPGYTFTDLSPSPGVHELNARMGFTYLDTTTSLTANLPWPSRPGRVRLLSDPTRIEAALGGEDLAVFRDHRPAAAARHLLVQLGDRHCYVVYRRDRRKGLPVFATLLHVSDPDVLRAAMRPFTRHLLLRARLLATLSEDRLFPRPARWAIGVGSPRRKMYKSSDLGPRNIDNLYSELVCVPW